jgi:hypothetical protein
VGAEYVFMYMQTSKAFTSGYPSSRRESGGFAGSSSVANVVSFADNVLLKAGWTADRNPGGTDVGNKEIGGD